MASVGGTAVGELIYPKRDFDVDNGPCRFSLFGKKVARILASGVGDLLCLFRLIARSRISNTFAGNDSSAGAHVQSLTVCTSQLLHSSPTVNPHPSNSRRSSTNSVLLNSSHAIVLGVEDGCITNALLCPWPPCTYESYLSADTIHNNTQTLRIC